jgi:hypothetical protein
MKSKKGMVCNTYEGVKKYKQNFNETPQEKDKNIGR